MRSQSMGRYHDHFVPEEGTWKIAVRRVILMPAA